MAFAENQNTITTEDNTLDIKKATEDAKHFEPAYDRILIKREISSLERRTKKTGIIITQQAQDSTKSSEGVLLKCGPTADEEAVKLIGKRILFAKYSGEDITIPLPDGTKEEFVLATDTDIFGELK